jgi:hypothetical protein
MNQIPSDEELRAVIPAMSRFAGIPIDANRLDAVGQAYQAATDWHTRVPPLQRG